MLRLVYVGFCVIVLLCSAACSGTAPEPTSLPASGVILQRILTDCWGVTQLKELDGTRADHTRAFECARARLLQMTRTYPDAAEPHRLLAWGYYFAMQDEDAARAEYERAAEIYEARGRQTEQADVLVQLASLALKYDRGRGCDILQRAAAIDPANTRAVQLLRNFACTPTPTPASTSSPTNG